MRTLTDGELEVLAEQNLDAIGGCDECDGDEPVWCQGCHCPVDDCDCRALRVQVLETMLAAPDLDFLES